MKKLLLLPVLFLALSCSNDDGKPAPAQIRCDKIIKIGVRSDLGNYVLTERQIFYSVNISDGYKVGDLFCK